MFSLIRRYYKFCRECGFMGRADRMLVRHWVVSHNSRGRGRFGFLKMGQLPRSHAAAFLEMLHKLKKYTQSRNAQPDSKQKIHTEG